MNYIQKTIITTLLFCISINNINGQGQVVDEGKYATFSKFDLENPTGRGQFNCQLMPGFDYTITGDIAIGDTSVPGPFQVVDNSGGGFETYFGQADAQQNIEIEVAGYFGDAGDPISMEVLTVLDFDFPVPSNQLGFLIADVEQDQVIISALDSAGQPVSVETISRWYKSSSDADNTDIRTIPPSWDEATGTLVGHMAPEGLRQSFYSEDLPDDEAGAAWFLVDIPITQLTFTSQALGVAPDDPSMHFIFASICNADISFELVSEIPETVGVNESYTLEIETCNNGTTDLSRFEVQGFRPVDIAEIETTNGTFDLPQGTCNTTTFSYTANENFTGDLINHEFFLIRSPIELDRIEVDVPFVLPNNEEMEEEEEQGYENIYPWLLNEISSDDCPTIQITEYDLGPFAFISLSDGRLFFEDGTFYCQSTQNRDCLALYDLNQSSISTVWNCMSEMGSNNGEEDGQEQEQQQEYVDIYPWLENVVQSLDCDQLTIIEYDLGSFSFVFLSGDNVSELYFQDGTFYCIGSATRDCRALYNLTDADITNEWTCADNGNSDETDEPGSDAESNGDNLFSDFPWISDILSPDCTTGSIEEYKSGIYTFILIDNGAETVLYFQDGTFYCQNSESFDCLELYGLTQVERTFTCDGMSLTQSESRSLEQLNNNSVSISPNPSSGNYVISHPALTSEFFIFDVNGKLIKQLNSNKSLRTNLDLTKYDSGLYIVKTLVGQQVISKKIVKL